MSDPKSGGPSEETDVDLAEILSVADADGASGDDDPPAEPRPMKEQLVALASRLSHQHTFRPGDMVRWKKGMRNKRHPDYGEPAIVIEVLDQPICDMNPKTGAGNPYFREPLTLVAGILDPEGDLVCYHFDGRRMEPCPD